MAPRLLGQYELLGLLGSGGMGDVYRARDTKLGRQVALKLLPEEMAGDEGRLVRFRREAAAIAALNHPNIVTLHAIDEAEGRHFLVMEYVEGKTLAELIPKQGLPLERILHISVRLAEALAAAHSSGITHRDLKPANIMVGSDGRLKVLDFGLAKCIEPEESVESAQLETLALTREGWMLGTAPYMSPEQVHARAVDPRSDIFSMGCVMHEMATGKMPFRGDSVAALISSILRDEPASISELRPELPRHLSRIIRRCLHKNPDRRYQTAKDLRNELDELKRELDTGELLAPPVTAGARRGCQWAGPAMWGAAGALALSGPFWVPNLFHGHDSGPLGEGAAQRSLVAFAVGEGYYESPAWSPDGDWLVYAADTDGNRDLWKRPLLGGEAERLTDSPAHETDPDWSPDGGSIAFSSDAEGGGIFLIPADGGTPYRLAERGRRPKWSPTGDRLLFDHQGQIYWLPSNGGEPTLFEAGTGGTPFAIWSADGRRILYWSYAEGDVVVGEIGSERRRALGVIPAGEEVRGLSLAGDGQRLILSKGPFGGNMDLFEVGLDPESSLTRSQARNLLLSSTPSLQIAVSDDGLHIAFTEQHIERHLYRIGFDPRTAQPTGEPQRLTHLSPTNLYPSLSPDGTTLVWTAQATGQGLLYGRRLDDESELKLTPEWGRASREVGATIDDRGQMVYSSTMANSYELWRLPAPGSVPLQVSDTELPYWDGSPTWCRGLGIVFEALRSESVDLWLIDATRAPPRPLVTNAGSQETFPSCNAAGDRIAFRSDRRGSQDLWLYEVDSGEVRPLETHPAEEAWAAWSADDRWLFFTSNRSGAFNVWVKPAGDGGHSSPFTRYRSAVFGLPEIGLFTKFAVGKDFVILPLESRTGEIYVLELGAERSPDSG